MAPSSTLAAKLAAEFVGTFLLVFTVGCNVLSSNPVWGGVSIACVLMVCIYALGGISGANFNPAVTLSLMLSKHPDCEEMDAKMAGMYMASQLAGGLCASLGYSTLFWGSFGIGPAAGFNAIHVGFAEALYTFMLCFVVLNVAIAKENTPNQFYGLAIGWVIVAGAYGAGAISGGCFNPAVSLAIDVTAPRISLFWGFFYVICEFVGAAAAALVFKVVRPADYGGEKTILTEAVSEFLGTFFLVLTVGLNVLSKSRSGVYSIAASLMCMIYALGDVSGAHFNPAVTLAIFASGRCRDLIPSKAGIFVAAQLAGGAIAGAAYSWIHMESFPLGPAKGWGFHNVDLVELIFTFLLCYVVLCVAVSGTTKTTTMFGLAIGACVMGGGKAIGDISGGVLNPAVGFGVSVAHLPVGGFASLLPLLSYTVAECAGAGLAAGVFKVTHAVDVPEVEKDIGA